MGMFEFNDVGIDLGTSSVLVYVKTRVSCCVNPPLLRLKNNGQDLCCRRGSAPYARKDSGQYRCDTSASRRRYFQFRHYGKTAAPLPQKVVGTRIFFKPRVVVCVPSGVTEVEKRSVIEATEEAGARHTYLIEEPIAAAIGAGIDISQPRGNMVVDIGGGTTDVAIISLGGSVLSESIKVAGDRFDESIVRYMRKKHNLLIGERTAEEMKIRIGSAYPRKEQVFIDVKGRNLISGLPQAITIGSNEMIDALEEPLQNILETVRNLFEKLRRNLQATLRKTAFASRAAARCFTAWINSLPNTRRFPAMLRRIPFPALQSARARCLTISTRAL